MASNAPYTLADGIAPDETKAMDLVRLISTEMEDPQLPSKLQKWLFHPHGILSIQDFKECPKNEVIQRITSADAAAYAMGMVLMIKRYLFRPPEDCERHPCRLCCTHTHAACVVPTPMPPALQMPQRCRVPPQGLPGGTFRMPGPRG